MMQVIFSLFTAFQLSSANRLLLQGRPPFAAPQPPAAIQQPEPQRPDFIIPQQPVNPQPVQPQPPQSGAPFAAPQQPVIPQTPQQPAFVPEPPQNNAPFVPFPNPQQPLPATPAIPNIDIKCDVPWTAAQATPGRCAGYQSATGEVVRHSLPMTVPLDGLKLNCAGYGSCAYTDFIFTVPAVSGNPVEFFEGLWFTEEMAAMGASITIINEQVNTAALTSGFGAANMLSVDKFVCDGQMSCQSLLIAFDSRTTVINEFICESGCADCWVEDLNPNTPAAEKRRMCENM